MRSAAHRCCSLRNPSVSQATCSGPQNWPTASAESCPWMATATTYNAAGKQDHEGRARSIEGAWPIPPARHECVTCGRRQHVIGYGSRVHCSRRNLSTHRATCRRPLRMFRYAKPATRPADPCRLVRQVNQSAKLQPTARPHHRPLPPCAAGEAVWAATRDHSLSGRPLPPRAGRGRRRTCRNGWAVVIMKCHAGRRQAAG